MVRGLRSMFGFGGWQRGRALLLKRLSKQYNTAYRNRLVVALRRSIGTDLGSPFTLELVGIHQTALLQ